MKPLKVFVPKNPDPIPYENLWNVLQEESERVLKKDLIFVGEVFILIKQEFEIYGEKHIRKALVGFLNKGEYKFYPHEDVFPEGVEFYKGIFKDYEYQFAPVMCIFKDEEKVVSSLREGEKIGEFEYKGVKTEVFLTDFKGEIPKDIYIADGHHRFEALEGDVLIALMDVNDPNLFILPTHRLIRIKLSELKRFLEGKEIDILILSSEEVLESVIREGLIPLIILPHNGKPLGFIPRRKDDALMNVPAYISDFYIFEGNYDLIVGYERDLKRVLEEGKEKRFLSVILSPTKPMDVLRVANEGKRMPRKSTDFYPKLVAGMFYAKP